MCRHSLNNYADAYEKTIKNIDIPKSFMHISYADAIDKYGTDKPDLRFDNQLFNVESVF